MKNIELLTLIFGLLFCSCNQGNRATSAKETQTVTTQISDTTSLSDDKEEIKKLIRQVYKWNEAQKPSKNDMITDNQDSIYIGFNLDQLKLDIDNLKATNLFSDEFIDNYNRIFLTLDKKLRTKEFEWLVGDLSPFGNDANPWCNCQDVPYDNPSPWDLLEVEIINLDNNKGELVWKWGKLELNEAEGWKEFAYKFRVVKENDKWKISYLDGFNFDEFTSKNY